MSDYEPIPGDEQLQELPGQEPAAESPGEQPEDTQDAGETGENEIEKLKKQNAELNDKYVRLLAEYDNFRKRSQKERDEIYPTATASAIAKLLPVIDSFERAAEFPHGDDEFGKGFDMIHQSLKEALAGLGVEELGKAGEAFDPAIHHAVMHVEDGNLGENVVALVLQKGYRLGDRVVRYAMVQTAN